MTGPGLPRLYGELAAWWPLLSAPADYVEEAEIYRRTLVEACASAGGSALSAVLELGAGGGNNASHLKAHFQMTLADCSPGMLAVSRALNPECEHVEGDMRSLRLDRLFDAALVHDAISYMTNEHDLRLAMETAFAHCRPGGAALFCPDHTRETFRPAKTQGGHDGERRGLRYFECTWDPDPADTTYVADFAYLLRAEGHPPRVEHDRHMLGLFEREVWLRLLAEAGFRARAVPFAHSTVGPGQEMFVGSRPA